MGDVREPVDDEGEQPRGDDHESRAADPRLEKITQRAPRPLGMPMREKGDARGDDADDEIDDAAGEEPEASEDFGNTLRRFRATGASLHEAPF